MKKFLKLTLIYLLVVGALGTLFLFVVLKMFPQITKGSYSEYSIWNAQKDRLAAGKDLGKNFIIGDSRAMSALNPLILGHGFENFSFGGSTPFEGYATLKRIAANHKIDTLLISYAASHYIESEVFESRTLAFDFINLNELEALEKVEDDLHSSIDKEGAATLGRLRRRTILKNIPYPYYRSSFVNNITKYLTSHRNFRSEVMESRGHILFGLADSSNALFQEAGYKDFTAQPVLASYLDSIVALGASVHAKIFFVETPLNPETYAAVAGSNFKKEYADWINSIIARHPEAEVARIKVFDVLPNTDFGDHLGHLNKKGSEKFSAALRDQLFGSSPLQIISSN